MSDTSVPLKDANDAEFKVDNELIGDVYRQRTQIGGDALGEIAAVQNTAPAGTEQALVVRPIPSGTQAISAAALPLPAGAATDSNIGGKLDTLQGSLAMIDGSISEMHVDVEQTVLELQTRLPAALGAAGGVKIEGVAGGQAVPVSGTVGVSGTVPVSGSVGVSSLPALPAGTNNIGDVDVLSLPALPAGTNNIGDVDVLSLPALPAGTNNIGDVDVLTVPARARTTDSIAVALQTDAVMAGSSPLTPKFAALSETATGEVIAAVTSKKIRVLAIVAVANVDGTFAFRDGAAGANLTGVMTVRQGGGFVLPFNPVGWFETTSGTRLDVVLSVVTQLSGSIVYVEV